MQKLNWIRDLFRHMEWADAIVWQPILKLEPHGEDRRLLELLYHSHSVQHAFLQVWHGVPLDVPKPAAFPDLNTILRWAREYHEKVPLYLDRVDDAALEQPMIVPWTVLVEKRLGRPAQPTTLAETMLQVTTHAAYHRGQINAQLRKLNVEPPMTDFIAWIWAGKPQADWPEAA
jgi:uncharacterized damage-inducible protein DinB